MRRVSLRRRRHRRDVKVLAHALGDPAASNAATPRCRPLPLGQVLAGMPRTRVRIGRPADSTSAVIASTRKAPAPAWRTASSPVTSSRCPAASVTSRYLGSHRTSRTVAATPSATSWSAASSTRSPSSRHPAGRPTVAGAQPPGLSPLPRRRQRRAATFSAIDGRGTRQGRAARGVGATSSPSTARTPSCPGSTAPASGRCRRTTDVVAGDAGPVEHEDHGAAVQPLVEVDLVEAQDQNVEYTATTGRSPAMAMPAADVT